MENLGDRLFLGGVPWGQAFPGKPAGASDPGRGIRRSGPSGCAAPGRQGRPEPDVGQEAAGTGYFGAAPAWARNLRQGLRRRRKGPGVGRGGSDRGQALLGGSPGGVGGGMDRMNTRDKTMENIGDRLFLGGVPWGQAFPGTPAGALDPGQGFRREGLRAARRPAAGGGRSWMLAREGPRGGKGRARGAGQAAWDGQVAAGRIDLSGPCGADPSGGRVRLPGKEGGTSGRRRRRRRRPVRCPRNT